MIDITSANDSLDLGVLDTNVSRAGNILSIQLGSLEYAPDLGIDLKYFLSEEFIFQNESFKAYLIQVLALSSISVASVKDTVDNLMRNYVINLEATENSSSLIAR